MATKKEFLCEMCPHGIVRLGKCDSCSPPKEPVVDWRTVSMMLLRHQDERLMANVPCMMCSYNMAHGDMCSYCV
jgi:hypothetical protein